ncbi:hypothetical protein [Helicobacter sp.]|uniref:hypothetical protein n=1 Tax=Helicobacter sp. TaxID=218 RepID=UPI0025C45488|nr:hypothetical protein [Helicobacter sp.]MCI5968371.1 hypothetical protein [Helicobacter sp.]MDY2584820.1 hypothetical protein [Helicobacter sp.]
MMFINNANADVYSKVYLATKSRDEAMLKAEEEQDLQNKNVGIKQSVKLLNQDEKNNYGIVQFSLNEERINLMLTKDNIARLREKFSADDFYQRSDGVLRLSGKAESYVGGWLSELLENMGADRADINGDGKFSGKERAMIASGYSYDLSSEKQGVVGKSAGVYNVQGYQAGEDSVLSKTLDDYVNEFISADKTLKGKVGLKDYAEQTQGSFSDAIKKELSAKENKLADMFAEAQMKVQPKKKGKSTEEEEEEARKKAAELLAKIKQNRDIESLTPEEKAVLKEYFAGEVEQLEVKDADSVNKHLEQSIEAFIEQIASHSSLVFEAKV